MRILIVEDEKHLADSLAYLLKSRGFETEVAYDGETGAEFAELGIYDLLILDVMMPGLDGYALARKVRAQRCSTPILMLTARSELEDRIEGLNAGADYYLTKPFDTRELLACINALLRRQGREVDELRCGNTSIELGTGMLCCGDQRIRLVIPCVKHGGAVALARPRRETAIPVAYAPLVAVVLRLRGQGEAADGRDRRKAEQQRDRRLYSSADIFHFQGSFRFCLSSYKTRKMWNYSPENHTNHQN